MADSTGSFVRSAHPRSRGENQERPDDIDRPRGSSPLTRGKRLHAGPRRVPLRLIPAHAGKTARTSASHAAPRAHPRSRGENLIPLIKPSMIDGSSPLTRGKRAQVGRHRVSGGLIPAHAGKTAHDVIRLSRHTAHPRSRGENQCTSTKEVLTTGSSPLTRGKHFPTCAFTAQIDQILETLELAVSSGSYSVWVACATDAPQDQVRSIGLVLPSSRGAS